MELVVALVILGLMAALVAPAIAARRADDGRRVSRELVELLLRARATATERGTAVTVLLDPADGRVWIGAGGERWLREDTLSPGRTVAVETRAPRARFVFTPGGMAFGDSVVIRDAAHALIVLVDPWTGEPRVAPR